MCTFCMYVCIHFLCMYVYIFYVCMYTFFMYVCVHVCIGLHVNGIVVCLGPLHQHIENDFNRTEYNPTIDQESWVWQCSAAHQFRISGPFLRRSKPVKDKYNNTDSRRIRRTEAHAEVHTCRRTGRRRGLHWSLDSMAACGEEQNQDIEELTRIYIFA